MTEIDRESHELFTRTIELPPSEWHEFLEKNCQSRSLRDRVHALLDAHSKSGDFLSGSVIEDYPNLSFPFGGQIEEFRIIRSIGKGGMGHVYLAEDAVLKRLVALKVVGLDGVSPIDSEEIVDRFRREARAAARLTHESVVKVYRTGEKDGLFYIAMEYVEGSTLREKIKSLGEIKSDDSDTRYKEVASLIAQVADAIDHAHRTGVIHRDIKPSNILIDRQGNARLADFGVARIVSEKTLRRTDAIVGSCAYMSPEQAKVLKADVDHRTDIFSLGVVLYESICLRRPFDGSDFKDILKELSDCRPVPAYRVNEKIPVDLAVICHKAIEKEVDHRYQSAAHFSADLRCFVDNRPILANPPSYRRRVRCWVGRNRRIAIAGIICLLLFAVVGLLLAHHSERLARQTAQNAAMGRLTIPDRYSGASVSVAPFAEDLVFGQSRVIGIAPVSTFLPPGLYRVSITSEDYSLEAITLSEAGSHDVVEVNNPAPEAVANMTEIPGKEYKLGSTVSENPLDIFRQVRLPAFLISTVEVSNREYREYVLATRSSPPLSWPDPYDEALDSLPVTGITWDEANEYCRWRGVRLPTPDEWEAAARGPMSFLYPWGNESVPGMQRKESRNLDLETYRVNVNPVENDSLPASPFGLKHMQSNVQEYTAGIDASLKNGLILKGRSWKDSPLFQSSDVLVLSSRSRPAFNRGFRVAISKRLKGESYESKN